MATIQHRSASTCCDADNLQNNEMYLAAVREQVARHFALDSSRIERILPCSHYQRDVMDYARENGRRLIGYTIYEIPSNINVERLAAAWKEVVRCVPTLRSLAFTSGSEEYFMAVLSESFTWKCSNSLSANEAIAEEGVAAFLSGSECNRFTVLHDPMENRQNLLIWTFNHALVDTAFQERVLQKVCTVYDGGELQRSSEPEALAAGLQVKDNERAANFWQQQFDNLDASIFPALPPNLPSPRPDAQAEYRISYPAQVQQKWKNTIVARAALGVLLSRYTQSSEALFGIVLERPPWLKGQERPMIDDGATRTIVPTRVLCPAHQSVSDFMQTITVQDSAMREFEQIDLDSIRRTSNFGAAACQFQTVLVVSGEAREDAPKSRFRQVVAAGLDRYAPYYNHALLLNCHMVGDSALLHARYDSRVVDDAQMTRFLQQLGSLIARFQSHSVNLLVQQLDIITQEDRSEIEVWNSKQLRMREVCIHEIISEKAAHKPGAIAVDAWDGQWTYAELDALSSSLAKHIRTPDLDLEQVVPLCFERSKWTIAGMLAVLKAGLAFTLIDPAFPVARIAQICRQTSAKVALSSKLHFDTMSSLLSRCIVLDDEFSQLLSDNVERVTRTSQPQDLAYVLFTSGSTGEPKGSMIEHRGFTSCALEFGSALGISSHTRALQFASYAFGACLLEIVTTLMHGGCVCVPSEADRMNNLPGFINKGRVNWALLTPSLIRNIKPESVPGLNTLVLVGEPMSVEMRDTWTSRVQLINGYGQSESSTICGATKITKSTAEPNNIGHAVGARFWITDPEDTNKLAPIGGIGELVIESPGVARGYVVSLPPDKSPFLTTPPRWYRPRQPLDTFNFYKTGDLASYRSDGTVVYLGRKDLQVKIRGQRVEIGDVETHLRLQLPDHIIPLVEAVKRSDTSGSTVLVAFLIGPFQDEENVADTLSGVDYYILSNTDATKITTKLQQVVAPYAVPSYYIRLKRLLTTTTGKTDRRRIRSIGSSILEEGIMKKASLPTMEPSALSSSENKLRQIWLQSLNLDPASNVHTASFFELGGDSLTAIKMVNMAREYGIEMSVTDVVRNPTFTNLVATIQKAVPQVPIPSTVYSGPVEQSFAQGRLWFLDQLNRGAPWYIIPIAVRLRGPLHVDALTAALHALEQRHESLRTTFTEFDGVGVQVVQPRSARELRIIDVSSEQDNGYSQILQQEQTTPFDIATEPGWRTCLLRLGKHDHILSIVLHHIIADGWSVNVLGQELSQFYAAGLRRQDPLSKIGPLPVQYRDFAMWQKQANEVAAAHKQQLEYWTKQLEDNSPAQFITDFPRPAILSGKASVNPVVVEGVLYNTLREFCRTRSVTPFTVLLATFRAAHYRFTGAEDATIGTPIANRNRHELEHLIGFFVNTQCMRIPINSSDTFDKLVRETESITAAAFANQDVPFERIVSALPGSNNTARNPLVQIMFAMHGQQDLGKIQLEGLASERIPITVSTRFDMEFHLFQEADRLTGMILSAKELFEPETIRSLISVFYETLRRGLEQPQTPIATISLNDGLVDLRNKGLLEVERTYYGRDSSIIDVFCDQVAASPDTIAVTDASSKLTYAELDQQSDKLALWLHGFSYAAETLIGVLAPRSCQTIVSFLGILKANLAYLPLDINVPVARIDAILSAIPGPGRRLLLLGSDIQLPEVQTPRVDMVRIHEALASSAANGTAPFSRQAVRPGPSSAKGTQRPRATSLAYTIFTSGSTGKPKGVMVEHRGVVRLVKKSNVVRCTKGAVSLRVPHLSNLAFDASTFEIYGALLNGGTVVCIDYFALLDIKTFESILVQNQIRLVFLSPALLKQCLIHMPATLKKLDVLFVAGDRFDVDDAIKARELVPNVLNAYGPTENTVLSTIYKIRKHDKFSSGAGVPLGRAVSNSGAYIMDPQQQLVPAGVMGELVVTGDGIARGYTDPALDWGRFVQVSIDDQTVKAYRTGDRVRYRPKDGEIEFFGRMDMQIKIRGHRIEPGEVESAILTHDAVHETAVAIRKQQGKDPQMIGFVTTHNNKKSIGEGEANNHVGGQDEVNNHVEGWETHFEESHYADIKTISKSAVGHDFTGWTSMYDGSAIDKAEMREWLDDTMSTLLDGQAPGHVLEIGTGTGMILFNLGKGLQSYVGLDPSKSAATFVNNMVKSIPSLADRAKVHVGTATDIGRLDGLRPDLVVINSVAQYFPTPEYLAQVVDALTSIRGIKRLFFGDIRTYAINKQFLAARALHTLGATANKDDIRQKMTELEEREEELLIDPAFFAELTGRLPHRVEHVEILPKRMRATNELSAYRYTAVVHLRGTDQPAQPVHTIDSNLWVDFVASELDRHSLLRLLQSTSDHRPVAISNIPYSKTITERYLVESLDTDIELEADGRKSLDGPAWLSAVRSRAERCASLSATDLVQLGKDAGFRVKLSWARQWSQNGGLDAVFHRYPSAKDGGHVMIRFPTDADEGRKSAGFTNRPLQRLQNRRLETQIRKHLQSLLPSYMVPERIMVLDQMPVNANSKIDRKELTRKAQIMPQAEKAVARVAPRNEVEAVLCEECADILGVEVGVTDDFFQLGGHSLMATKLAARISRRLNTRLSVKDVFDHPMLSDLAVSIRRAGSTPHSLIQPKAYNGPVELSFAQGRLWFLDQVVGSRWYIMPLAVRLRGPLLIDALAGAFFRLQQRHEMLRTTFEEHDGVGIQIVHERPSCAKDLRIIDAREQNGDFTQILRHKQTTPFNLASEPGWRVCLIQLGVEDYVLSIVMHHIISDGWSVDILGRELGQFYATGVNGEDPFSKVPPLPIQYRDFAIWQKTDQATEHQRQLEYWVQELKNSSPAELITDFPRPAKLSGEAGVIPVAIEGSIYENLRSYCRQRQVTPFTVLLATFRAAHYRLTGTEDAMIGTPIANRNRSELEGLIGFFVNNQCMRITVNSDTSDTFDELVQQVRSTTAAAFANQDVPFERIVQALLPGSNDTSRNPLTQLVFAVHSHQSDLGKILELEGLSSDSVPIAVSTRFDVEFHLFQNVGSLNGMVLFAKDLFEQETICNMISVFNEILRRGLDQPETPIATMPLTDGLVDLRSTINVEQTDYPRESSIVDVFREQASLSPDAIAVCDASTQLTYSELDQQSDQLALWLCQRCLASGPLAAETLVGVLAPRSCLTIVAFLGILKANCAYLPLDINVPEARIKEILSAVPGQQLVLVGSDTKFPDMLGPSIEMIRIDDALRQHGSHNALDASKRTRATLDQRNAADASRQPRATNLAYVMFTSGSTGKPKGVQVEHRGVVRLVKQTNIISATQSAVPIAHLSNLAFDASTWEIYAALLNGGTVVCIDYLTTLDSKALEAVFREKQIRATMLPPALLKQCLVSMPATLKALDVMLVAGDRFDSSDAIKARNLVPNGLYNAYGPTENTVLSAVYKVKENDQFGRSVPIGRAISNSGAYIINPQQQLVSAGVMGELVVTGDGLTRGYIDSTLNAGRFVQIKLDDQPAPVRAYRTGDRVRFRPKDYQIEFFGRMDLQFKIRGHRIEPGEVEHAMLKAHNDVRHAAIVIREQPGQEPEMVGFVATHGDDSIGTQIRDRLKNMLPSYMVPVQIVRLDEMPLNTNGKMDRRELIRKSQVVPRIEATNAVRVAPRNEIEAALCEEFADVLSIKADVNNISITDNFFNLGGHSLMATKLAARVSRRFDTRLSIKDVFDHPILQELATVIRQGSTPHIPIEPSPYEGPIEQSFAQGRLWFLEQVNLGSRWYIIPLAVRLRGPLVVDALAAALLALEQRHETLRTRFEEQNGMGVQIVQPSRAKMDLRVIDIPNGNWNQILRHEQTTTFDLASETAWRVRLLKIGEDDHILSIVMHHIISDGWSIEVLTQELGQLYAAVLDGQNQDPISQLRPLPVQYRDFAMWQKQQGQKAEHQQQLNYWTEKLKDSSPAELVTDFPRPKVLSGAAGIVPISIEGPLYEKLREFCRTRQVTVTPFIMLLATFRASHYRLTGAQDATIATPIANRNRPELESLIGFFVNTQCIRINVGDDDSFDGLVNQVQSTVKAAFANQDVPFERIVSSLLPGSNDTSRNPLAQLMFALHSQQDLGKVQFKGLASEPVPMTAVSTRFDIEFHLVQEVGRLSGMVLYSEDLFEPETIRSMVYVFNEILRYGLEVPQTPVATMPLLGTDGLVNLRNKGLLDIRKTAYPRESNVVDIFREQAAASPNAIAVLDTFSNLQLTYSELNQQSDELAAFLHQRCPMAETQVGVLAPRSCQTAIAFLGILKANLAYLPLDVNVPAARVDAILSTIPGQRLLLLGSNAHRPNLQTPDVEMVRMHDALDLHWPLSSANGSDQPEPTSLAYVIYTSGSTGKPKGIMVEHRAILRMVKKSNVISKLPPAPRIAHMTNLTFDVSVWEICIALLNGGTLFCIDYFTTLNGMTLLEVFKRHKLDTAFFSPALLKYYLSGMPTIFRGLQALYVGGERFQSRDATEVHALVPGSVYNLYGPSENALGSSIYQVTAQETSTNGVPIGRSVSNSGAYVMDSQQRLVPVGVMGELVVTGDGLARGYTDPALDLDRFIEITMDGERIKAYRTGDRVRYRPIDGQLEFFGRMDHQVKIRGNRIELAEVEEALLRNASLQDAVALVRELDGQEKELISFVTLRGLGVPTVQYSEEGGKSLVEDIIIQHQDSSSPEMEASLRTALKHLLPSYMIPTRICVLENMPLNTNGKIDRQALAKVKIQPAAADIRTRVIVSPRNDTERSVCEEFTTALGLEAGITDNFFELGGHSLMATSLASRISRRLHLRCTVADIFTYPVVVDLAEKLSRSLGTVEYAPIPRLQTDGPVEQSFAQVRLWTVHQLFPTTTTFLLRQATRISGPLRMDALGRALLALEERHDLLRTTFEQRDGVSVQIVHPFIQKELQVVDIVESELMDSIRQEQDTPFDLETEPAWRPKIFRLDKEDHVLSLMMHHIIYDGWTIDLIVRELATFYAAAIQDQDLLAHVRPLVIQYRDFAVWEKQEAQVAEHQRQLDYWKKQLYGSQPAELLHDKPQPTARTRTVEVLPMDIVGDLHRELKQFCKLYQATPYTVLLAAFGATHHRLTGMDDATVGMLVANRNRQELEDIVGFFVNLLCLRLRIKDASFGEFVQQVQETTAAASENQDVPFESVLAELRPEARGGVSGNPLVKIEFIVNPQHNIGRLQLDGMETELMEVASARGKRTSPFDIEFHFFEEEDMMAGSLAYSDELFTEASMRSMISLFFQVLRHGLKEPDILIKNLALMN